MISRSNERDLQPERIRYLNLNSSIVPALLLLLMLLLVVTACTQLVQPVPVSNVTVEQTDEGPVAVVEGEFSDACGSVGPVVQRIEGDTVRVAMAMAPVPQDMMCAQVLTQYTHTIPLDTEELAPGAYEVSVNGVAAPYVIGAGPMADEPPRLATITNVEAIQENDRLTLAVSGDLPDPCHEVGEVTQNVAGDDLTITVPMIQPEPDMICAQVITPFSIEVTIDEALEPGDYTVNVNDYTTQITVE